MMFFMLMLLYAQCLATQTDEPASLSSSPDRRIHRLPHPKRFIFPSWLHLKTQENHLIIPQVHLSPLFIHIFYFWYQLDPAVHKNSLPHGIIPVRIILRRGEDPSGEWLSSVAISADRRIPSPSAAAGLISQSLTIFADRIRFSSFVPRIGLKKEARKKIRRRGREGRERSLTPTFCRRRKNVLKTKQTFSAQTDLKLISSASKKRTVYKSTPSSRSLSLFPIQTVSLSLSSRLEYPSESRHTGRWIWKGPKMSMGIKTKTTRLEREWISSSALFQFCLFSWLLGK